MASFALLGSFGAHRASTGIQGAPAQDSIELRHIRRPLGFFRGTAHNSFFANRGKFRGTAQNSFFANRCKVRLLWVRHSEKEGRKLAPEGLKTGQAKPKMAQGGLHRALKTLSTEAPRGPEEASKRARRLVRLHRSREEGGKEEEEERDDKEMASGGLLVAF